MSPLSPHSDRNEYPPAAKPPGAVPLGVQRQAWLAAALLFSPWLATLFLWRTQGVPALLVMIALLPGLMVALHLQRQLLTRLATNHRCGEEDHPFPTLGAATWITLTRAAAVVALAGFLPLAIPQGQPLPPTLGWAPGLLYLGIALADLLDGFVARRQDRATELGKRLDIETDAAGLLVASLVAVGLHRLPPFVLLAGLAYYPFIVGIWLRRRRQLPLVALQSRPYSRIIAGFQMGLVGGAMLPILNPSFLVPAALLVTTPLLIGFVRDWLVVSCWLPTGRTQHTPGDDWAELVLLRLLPLVARLGILVGGIVVLAGSTPSQPSSPWLAALGTCCLLAGLGCLCRGAALGLSLLLGCTMSPFGASAPVLALFVAAVTLMLTGPGPLSLWSPEERILYRGDREETPRRVRESMALRLDSSLAAFLTASTGWRGLLLVLGLALTWHAVRGMAWFEAWTLLAGLGPGALLMLLALNLLLLPLMTARWRQLLKALGAPIGLLPACAYRCAANAVSYLTPGPHFGGEPLSVHLLHTQQGIPLPVATTSVALDRLLELLASTSVLCLGLLVLTATGRHPLPGGWSLALAVLVLTALVVLLAALFTGKLPLSRLAAAWGDPLDCRESAPAGITGALLATLVQGEALATSLGHRQRGQLLLANLFSLGHWLGVFAEFGLMATLLGRPLAWYQLVALVITARLAFLTPLPAGLGALETALPWMTATLGLGSILGLSLCLLIRLRDLLFSLAGLGLTMKYLTCPGRASTLGKDAGRKERRG